MNMIASNIKQLRKPVKGRLCNKRNISCLNELKMEPVYWPVDFLYFSIQAETSELKRLRVLNSDFDTWSYFLDSLNKLFFFLVMEGLPPLHTL